MIIKKIAALVALVLIAVPALAQPVRPADLTVSKNLDQNADAGMFTTIQAAVNAARQGQIIEILDTEIYREQVTIDGRDESPWPGVTGGKNGITIRSRNPTSLFKPTILYQDNDNRSPRTFAESQRAGELTGTSGNFETCGALRIIRAQGVTIDGIIIDGGGASPFAWESIWGQQHPLFHGNAAVTLVVASTATIRNCEMKNAYFGVNVKDRNTGGVFGNPNRNDNDHTVPLSGFGRVGAHLIEYNRVHSNSIAFFFESAWDLGSTVRYNLVYDNFHAATTITRINALGGPAQPGNRASGAFVFKDMTYSPVAIYNNTFFRNFGNFFGDWKIGATHLIFNNIYGRPSPNYTGAGAQEFNNARNGMGIEGRFPHRTNSCIYSAVAALVAEERYVSACRDETLTPQIHGQQIRGITQARIFDNNFPQASTGPTTVSCIGPLAGMTVTASDFIPPGVLLSDANIPASANIRWLETSRSIEGTEDLFESTDPMSPDFLRPRWSHPLVAQYIRNKGWDAIGMRNSDGLIADIGAIPSTGRAPATVARIRPSNVVLISGTNASASFYINLDHGQLTNPRIKFLRWVSPLPLVPMDGNWGNDAPIVPSTAIRDITPPANANLVVNGNNRMNFTVPTTGTGETYGFFEIVIEGTDANGNLVATDVGFLPYRTLSHFLDLHVFGRGDNTMTTPLTQVMAGDTVRLRVTARTNSGPFIQPITDMTYDLLSDATAFMTCVSANCPGGVGQALTTDASVVSPKLYEVVFTRAGAEVIMGAGRSGDLVFLGSNDIRVNPGPPHTVVFLSPIPKAQLPPGTQPQVMPRGVDHDVTVEVQDRFGNAVNQAAQVTIAVTAARNVSGGAITPPTGVADAGTPGAFNAANASFTTRSVNTDPATGIATFAARVTNGSPNEVFDMTATLTVNNATDVGSLRISRILDRLQIFYADTTWPNPNMANETILGRVGEWFQITVKAVDNDAVIPGKNGCVLVEPSNPNIIMSATEGGAPATTFTMSNSTATFWISAAPGTDTDIPNACLDVSLMLTGCTTPDNSILPGNRCDISFIRPTSNILNATVYGDGFGRPDSVYVRFALDGQSFTGTGAAALPDSVMLKWPPNVSPANQISITVRQSAIRAVDSVTINAVFSGQTSAPPQGLPFPAGYTEIMGNGMGLVTVYGGLGNSGSTDDLFEVLDGIGLLIADTSGQIPGRWSPMIIERVPTDPPGTLDTLIIQLTEELFDDMSGAHPLQGLNTLLYTTEPNPNVNPSAVAGTRLDVQRAFLDVQSGGFKVVLAQGTTPPAAGNWIRLNPAGGITDVAAVSRLNHPNNPVHANNRWAQVILKPVPPEITSAYYTSVSSTGRLEYAYITFNKEVDISWFAGGYFKFSLPGVGTDSVAVGSSQFLASVDGDPMSVRVTLSSAFPSSQDTVFTGGSGMSVAIGFNPVMDFPALNVAVTDGASPVLVREVVLKVGAASETGTDHAPDTLVVIYSEPITEEMLRSIAQPVIIQGRDPITLRLASSSNMPGTSYLVVTYVIESTIPIDRFPANGDLVYINPAANFTDASGNVQDAADNRRVPLRVDRTMSWKVTITNNPFSSGSASMVTVSPNAKGAEVEVTAKIRIYNNMGNLVVDTTITKAPNVASWLWTGHNSRGRMVGTGTYLLRISSEAVVVGSTEPPQRHTEGRAIGFIRGKR